LKSSLILRQEVKKEVNGRRPWKLMSMLMEVKMEDIPAKHNFHRSLTPCAKHITPSRSDNFILFIK
jgi:hypothetical protein